MSESKKVAGRHFIAKAASGEGGLTGAQARQRAAGQVVSLAKGLMGQLLQAVNGGAQAMSTFGGEVTPARLAKGLSETEGGASAVAFLERARNFVRSELSLAGEDPDKHLKSLSKLFSISTNEETGEVTVVENSED